MRRAMLTNVPQGTPWGYEKPWNITFNRISMPSTNYSYASTTPCPKSGTVTQIDAYMYTTENYRFFTMSSTQVVRSLTGWFNCVSGENTITGLSLACEPGDMLGWWCGGGPDVPYASGAEGDVLYRQTSPELGKNMMLSTLTSSGPLAMVATIT